MDGPMSFSTSRVSIQWALRFEFFITPKNVDWSRYDHLPRAKILVDFFCIIVLVLENVS
ncbi:hypothetical protein LINPERPRIM_LOCUS33521 [Linum perenne]